MSGNWISLSAAHEQDSNRQNDHHHLLCLLSGCLKEKSWRKVNEKMVIALKLSKVSSFLFNSLSYCPELVFSITTKKRLISEAFWPIYRPTDRRLIARVARVASDQKCLLFEREVKTKFAFIRRHKSRSMMEQIHKKNHYIVLY